MYAAVPRIIPAWVIAGEVIVGGASSRVRGLTVLRVLRSWSALCESEVEHLHRAVGAHLDVRGLEIAMDDALLVRRFERFRDLSRDRQRLVDRDRSACDPLDESSPSTSSITSADVPSLSSKP